MGESDEEEKARERRRVEEYEREIEGGRSSDEDVSMEPIEEEEERTEQEQLEDLKERDTFAEPIQDQDREKTKKWWKIGHRRTWEPPLKLHNAVSLQTHANVHAVALPSLRLHSGQEYLIKCEIQQIELLGKEIADVHEALFSGMKISKRGRKELERKKELLKLERLKINVNKNAQYQPYGEAKPKDDQFATDVDQWEASQTKHSTFRTGAMDKAELVDGYGYVFDES
ncbi:hypothetical protein VKT23_016584 [Stygiomarasmius scandens]|uniref:Uncharacterized protein n=1 Tax=Marasmiellus scandens TaxID=2682957 RepID=A0ABR1IUI9_9AGAR